MTNDNGLTVKDKVLWQIANIQLREIPEELEQDFKRFRILEDRYFSYDDKGRIGTIYIREKNTTYTVENGIITKSISYRGKRIDDAINDGMRELLDYCEAQGALEDVYNTFKNKIDSLSIGLSEFKNIDKLTEEYITLKYDIQRFINDREQEQIIDILQKAGIKISAASKEYLCTAIDKYLSKRVKTIDELD